ncbi:MAG: potassium channel family protein, partial [Thiohalocapsa sp.]
NEYTCTLKLMIVGKKFTGCVKPGLMLLGLTLAWAEDWTLGDAAYFTLITGLTVGYGDMTPVTTLGRIASIASAIVGIVATGLYVAIASKAVATAIHGQRLSRDIKIADADVD